MEIVNQPKKQQAQHPHEDDDFTLNAEQMEFMMQNHNAAERAYGNGDMQFFRDIMDTGEWKSLFPDFGWDQAWDRYEIMIGTCEDC